jgi:LysM repeat protein
MGGIVAGAIFLLSVFKPIPSSSQDILASVTPPKPTTIKTPTPTKIPPTPTPIIHKVESGDTLYTIAEEHYGSQKYWINIWNDNDWIEDPRLIRGGWEIKISENRPKETEEPSPKLAKMFEEITSPSSTPSPTPEPIKEPQATTIVQAPIGSFEEAYKQAGARYGVPWEILYGLHYMETGLRDGAISSGYGTGAQGPMQFMPGTWATYGIDGNGDGAVDINNAIDAIFGAANYLAAHGGVENGLKAYGGDSQKALDAARFRGYSE